MAGKVPAIASHAEFAPFSGRRGKAPFPAQQARKGGNSTVGGRKKRDDFGLLHRRLFEIEPFFCVLRFSLQCTKYLGFLLIQKSVDFRQLIFQLFLARDRHVQFRAFLLEGNVLAGKLLTQRPQTLLRKKAGKMPTSNSRFFSLSWSISD